MLIKETRPGQNDERVIVVVCGGSKTARGKILSQICDGLYREGKPNYAQIKPHTNLDEEDLWRIIAEFELGASIVIGLGRPAIKRIDEQLSVALLEIGVPKNLVDLFLSAITLRIEVRDETHGAIKSPIVIPTAKPITPEGLLSWKIRHELLDSEAALLLGLPTKTFREYLPGGRRRQDALPAWLSLMTEYVDAYLRQWATMPQPDEVNIL